MSALHVPTLLAMAATHTALLALAGAVGAGLWLSIPVCEQRDAKQANGATEHAGRCRVDVPTLLGIGGGQSGSDRNPARREEQDAKPKQGDVSEARPSALVPVGETTETSDKHDRQSGEANPHFHPAILTRGKREWNGRFIGSLERLCVETRAAVMAGRTCESRVLKAALALSIALEDDNEIDAKEVRQNRATIEAARDALDALLGKLRAAA